MSIIRMFPSVGYFMEPVPPGFPLLVGGGLDICPLIPIHHWLIAAHGCWILGSSSCHHKRPSCKETQRQTFGDQTLVKGVKEECRALEASARGGLRNWQSWISLGTSCALPARLAPSPLLLFNL